MRSLSNFQIAWIVQFPGVNEVVCLRRPSEQVRVTLFLTIKYLLADLMLKILCPEVHNICTDTQKYFFENRAKLQHILRVRQTIMD